MNKNEKTNIPKDHKTRDEKKQEKRDPVTADRERNLDHETHDKVRKAEH